MRAYYKKNNQILIKKGSEKIIKYYDCFYDIFEIFYVSLPSEFRSIYAKACFDETRKHILINRFNAICLFYSI